MKGKGFEYIRHFNSTYESKYENNKLINANWYYPSEYGQATIGIYIHNDDIYVGIARLSTKDKDYVKSIGIKVMRTKYIPLLEYFSTKDKYQKIVVDVLAEALMSYAKKCKSIK